MARAAKNQHKASLKDLNKSKWEKLVVTEISGSVYISIQYV